MRIWSLHPKYLDTKGLLALWRESLLAQQVLLGKTKGYRNHPQLHRFKIQKSPVGAISEYLCHVYKEARSRNYHFDEEKIFGTKTGHVKIPVTQGQVDFEFQHLLTKLKTRAPEKYQDVSVIKTAELHPLFLPVEGEIECWERVRITKM